MPAASPQHSDLRPPSPRQHGSTATSPVRWQREVPKAICSLGAIANADYADIVTVAVAETPADPEQFVYARLKEVPRGLLWLVSFVQRVFLGFRLRRGPSPDHLLGWKISDRGENWMRIETASWFMTAHVVIHADAHQLSLASFIRYDRWPAALVWPPVSLIHRQAGLVLMRSVTQAR
jgi:hypothetical protein